MTSAIFYDGMEDDFIQCITQTKHHPIVLLADANTNGFCVHLLKNKIPAFKKAHLIVIPQGEMNKTLEACSLIWNQLDQYKAGRSTLLINIGGGMISDLGGFAASVYKRGINFIHIPTTLLSMVDACYGGKTGIDFHHIKNLLGTINHPLAIYIQPQFLESLDQRILTSGFAESIKHALIASEDWWNEQQSYTTQDFTSLTAIRRSLDVKRKLVMQDEKDAHERQQLNFGHTMGHAIESYALRSDITLYHGEAVMLGMLHELIISEKLLNLTSNVRPIFEKLLHRFFPNLNLRYTVRDLEPFLLRDKKTEEGINMSLLRHPGNCQIKVPVDMNTIAQSLAI